MLSRFWFLFRSCTFSLASFGSTDREMMIMLTLNQNFFVSLACCLISYVICSSFIFIFQILSILINYSINI